MIKTLLIANRGEIACRIIRTCQKLGIRTVAVYSDADEALPHVTEADTAVHLGPSEALNSYLNIDKIIQAAKYSGADAIHPGYGFLSENNAFSQACSDNGIVFIGPPAQAIAVMGDKAAARQLMAENAVPVLPGFDKENCSDEELRRESANVGFPLLIKAVAGGGGKGMRVVNEASEFDSALAAARREAMAAFSDDRVLLERYLPKARHVEVQVFADNHGHCIHLFERDCSVQRRHQKIIEEAPAPGLSEDLRQRMGEAAVQAAKAIHYSGAGTVEFLLAENTTGGQDEFFFMEMNTRLQVEHPVTELITEEDLVAWQIAVANNETLPKQQHELQRHGHAMEVRIYAEDPGNQFLPSAGLLNVAHWPQQLARVDTGYYQGQRVTSFYDPMLAKIIVHGDNRDQARQKLISALLETHLEGIAHNISFLIRVLENPDFANADLDTRLLERAPELLEDEDNLPVEALAAAYVMQQRPPEKALGPWQSLPGWRALGDRQSAVSLAMDHRNFSVLFNNEVAKVSSEDDEIAGAFKAHINGNNVRLSWSPENHPAQLWQGQVQALSKQQWLLSHRGISRRWQQDPARCDQQQQSSSPFAAPMSGRIVALHVTPGDAIEAGDAVITLEAMKMEHTLTANTAGTVEAFLAQQDEQVTEGMLLVEFSEAAAAE